MKNKVNLGLAILGLIGAVVGAVAIIKSTKDIKVINKPEDKDMRVYNKDDDFNEWMEEVDENLADSKTRMDELEKD
jgi:hypothetical protein